MVTKGPYFQLEINHDASVDCDLFVLVSSADSKSYASYWLSEMTQLVRNGCNSSGHIASLELN